MIYYFSWQNRLISCRFIILILEVNIISGKVSIASVNRACGRRGALSPSAGVLGARALLRKCLGYKEHLDLPKIDLNAAKITTVQDY